METKELVAATEVFIKEKFSGGEAAHDWWHIWRVWQLAKRIAAQEGGNLEVVELGALLHDIADWKFHGGSDEAGPAAARAWLESQHAAPEVLKQVLHIVEHVSYKGAGEKEKMESLEGKIVQDADRLDALGAIGIGRTFAYGGYKQRPMYDPTVPVERHDTAEQYKSNNSPTINHFYEKLLLLKDRMHTPTGRAIALERHRYMEDFLERFMEEWKGEK